MNAQLPQGLIQMRQQIIDELNIGHLSPEEQDQVISGVGEMLLSRVILKIMSMVPADAQARLEALLGQENNEAAIQSFIEQNVPNSNQVIAQEIRAGLDEHKMRVTQLAAGRAG